MEAADPYGVLGVPSTATAEEIRQAFRARARRLHPDVNPAPEAPADFARLRDAYDVLRDPERRARLDRQRRRQDGANAPSFTWTNIAGARAAAQRARREQPPPDGPDGIDEAFDAIFGG